MSRTRQQDSPRRPRTPRSECWTREEIQAAYDDHRAHESAIDAWIEDEIDRQIEGAK